MRILYSSILHIILHDLGNGIKVFTDEYQCFWILKWRLSNRINNLCHSLEFYRKVLIIHFLNPSAFIISLTNS